MGPISVLFKLVIKQLPTKYASILINSILIHIPLSQAFVQADNN